MIEVQPERIFNEDGMRLSLPKYATDGAAGADLQAFEDGVLEPQRRALVRTGIKVAIPSGFEMQIRPRSGLSLKHGITVLNMPATIDSDYRGEVGVVLINHGTESFAWRAGDRIAQAVVVPVVQARFVSVVELEDSTRGGGGFGSTGV